MDQEPVPARGRGRVRGRRGRGRGRGRVQAQAFVGEGSRGSSHHVAEEEVAQQAQAPGGLQGGNQLLDLLRQAIGGGNQQDIEMDRRIKLYETVIKIGPKEFEGTSDPFVAEDWLRQLVKAFALMRCRDEDKLSCVLHLLKGDADVWWTNVTNSQANPNIITWQFFEERFRSQYIPEVHRERKIQEFLALRQDDGMSVEDYKMRFQHLERYGGSLVPTEADKCRKFLSGLHVDIKEKMATVRTKVFDELVAIALQAEQFTKEREEEKKKTGKRDHFGAQTGDFEDRPTKKGMSYTSQSNTRAGVSSFGGNSRFRASHASVGTPGGSRGGRSSGDSKGPRYFRPTCTRCGRDHPGECRYGQRGCFHCGQ